MKYTFSLYIATFFILISCSDGVQNNQRNKYTNKCKLEYLGIKELPLDDETSNELDYISFIDNNGCSQLFTFVNNYSNSIYFYDYKNSTFLRKIKYEKEGADGVMKIQGFLYLNEDSIFVYSHSSKMLCLTNSDAKVLDRYKLYERTMNDENRTIIYPSPYLQTISPLKKIGDYIVSVGFFAEETSFETTDNRPVSTMLNLKDKKIEHCIGYPAQYAQYNWGGDFMYRMPYYDVNDTSMIISFSADHSILLYNKNTESKFYAGSSEIKSIKPGSTDKDKEIDNKDASAWYSSNPSYEGVLYDKYRNLYYRIARLPKKDSERQKPIVVIALDSNLQYLGEVMLPKEIYLDTTNCFVSEEGINMQIVNSEEDKLSFYQFNISYNEN